jgi:hypothetical protein
LEESILSKLSRYETTIARQMYRVWYKLARWLAGGRGAALTPPHVVDVEVSGMPEETGR